MSTVGLVIVTREASRAISDPEEGLDFLVEASTAARHTPGPTDVASALDPAANGFQSGAGHYQNAESAEHSGALVTPYGHLVDSHPIRSIEDGFADDDHAGWKLVFERLEGRIRLIGHDLDVTSASRIQDGVEKGCSNAALIEPNDQSERASDRSSPVRRPEENESRNRTASPESRPSIREGSVTESAGVR